MYFQQHHENKPSVLKRLQNMKYDKCIDNTYAISKSLRKNKKQASRTVVWDASLHDDSQSRRGSNRH